MRTKREHRKKEKTKKTSQYPYSYVFLKQQSHLYLLVNVFQTCLNGPTSSYLSYLILLVLKDIFSPSRSFCILLGIDVRDGGGAMAPPG